MKVRDGIRRSAVAIEPDATIRRTAAVMEQAGVGCVAVVDGDALVGIVTDRDLVRRALATGLAGDARVDAVMSAPVITISADVDLHDAFAVFRTTAVRRLAVVEGRRLIGIISIDDLLVDLAADLGALLGPIDAELRHPQHDSPVPVVT